MRWPTPLRHPASRCARCACLSRSEGLTCILVLHNYFEAMNAEEELALAQVIGGGQRGLCWVPWIVLGMYNAPRIGGWF